MSLEDRLAQALAARKPESKRMFGGTCFMLNGNMLVGTFKDGIIVRIGPAQNDAALKLPGARPFEMNGRVSKGFVMVNAASLETGPALQKWIDLALAFNATLPPKQAKAAKTGRKAAKRA